MRGWILLRTISANEAGADSSKFPIVDPRLREVGFPPFMQQVPGDIDTAERIGALPPDVLGLLTVVAGCVTLRLMWSRCEAAGERLDLGSESGLRSAWSADARSARSRQRPVDAVSAVRLVDGEYGES